MPVSSSFSSGSSGSPARSIHLLREAQEPYAGTRFHGFRLRVTARDGYLINNEVFLFLRGTINPDSGEPVDRFSNICSPVDMEEYSINEPTGLPPFYRRNEVDLVFRSQAELDEAWNALQSGVHSLIESMNRMDTLSVTDLVEIS